MADSSGAIVAQAQVPVSTHRHGENVEQDPAELVDSLRQCCQAVSEQLGKGRSRISSAGLATQRSSIVCWGRASGRPLSPVLSWQDRRAWQFVDSLKANADRIKQITGLVLSPHYGASKLRWCLTKLDQVRAAQKDGELIAGPLASFLAHQLTDAEESFCDPANASRTQLWDFTARGWSDELCGMFEVDAEILPTSVPTRHAYGNVLVGDNPVPLEVVTGDQSAAIYAFGEPSPETVYINMGTGAFLQWPSGDVPRTLKGMLNSVVFQDESTTKYVLEGTVNGAGSALSWFGKQSERDSKELITSGLEEIKNDRPPYFINGISGLGSPYWVSELASTFSEDASPGLKAIAVLESVAFLICENLRCMRSLDQPIKKVLLSGGLATVDYLCQAIADVSGLEVERSSTKEATAVGVLQLLANQDTASVKMHSTLFRPNENGETSLRYRAWQDEMTTLLN